MQLLRFALVVTWVAIFLIGCSVLADIPCNEHHMTSDKCTECCFKLGVKPSMFVKSDHMCRCGSIPQADGANFKCAGISMNNLKFKQFKEQCTKCCHDNGKRTPLVFMGDWCKCSRKDYKKKD